MTKPRFILGCDPDADKHGIAVYKDGTLIELKQLRLMEIVCELQKPWVVDVLHNDQGLLFSIEDVCANNFPYGRNDSGDRKVMHEKGRYLGKVQHSQVELMRVLEYYSVPYELHKPTRGNWAKPAMKAQFEKVTGWTKPSNPDTRSAAYMGWLAVR